MNIFVNHALIGKVQEPETITRAPFPEKLTASEDTAITNFINSLGTIYSTDIEEMFFFGFSNPANNLVGWKGVKVATITGANTF